MADVFYTRFLSKILFCLLLGIWIMLGHGYTLHKSESENTDRPHEKSLKVEDARKGEKCPEETSHITSSQDSNFPGLKPIKIRDSVSNLDVWVKVFGWVHSLTRQDEDTCIDLRDGTGFMKCVFSGKMRHANDVSHLAKEASICVYGQIMAVPQKGKLDPSCANHELKVEFWEMVGASPPGESESILNKEAHVDVQRDNHHMIVRGEKTSKVLKMRSIVMQCFRDHYFDRGYFEVTPPTLVHSQVEVGSTLFKLDYFGDMAYLTQSSQLYLETVIPSMGDVFCFAQSYRPEQSCTRRHLTEYTHIEAECPFLTFDDLLDRIEDLVCDVVDRVLKSPYGSIVQELNPHFKPPKRPFRRMDYADAIKYLKENNIKKDDGTYYEFGEDIPEAPERNMTDKINEPILLCRFPTQIKPFYMQPCLEDPRLTESVDLLMPNVGEIVGGSMRMWKYEQLMDGFKREGTDPTKYYWYTDQRKFGTCPHGGYGLGLERFLCWLLNRYHIREVVLYPRFVNRCNP